jgi:hypothetical protein
MSWTDADVATGEWSDADVAKPDSILKRTLTGMADPVYGLGQMADKAIDPIRQMISPGASSMDDVVAQRNAEYQAPEGVDWARMGGNVASPVNLAALPLQAGNRMVSAGAGALSAMAEPTEATGLDFIKEKIQKGVLGGGIGFAIPGIPKTDAARKLMEQGIQPTVGQSAGGWVNKLEQATESWPIIGSSTTNARQRPLNEFQVKVFEQATGLPVKTIDEANTAVSGMYQSVAPHLPMHNLQPQFYTDFQKALQNPELTPTNQKLLYDLTANRFANYEKLSGNELKTLDSDIGALIRKYQSSADVSHHAVADGLKEIQTGMRSTWETLLPPDMKGKLQQANQAYARMVPVNKAASARGDERVMPRALQKAMARQAGMDTSRMAPNDLVDSALKVLPNNLPDSGTAGRLLATDMDTLGKAALLKIPVAIGASRPMQRILTGNTNAQTRYAPTYSSMVAAALRKQKQDDLDDISVANGGRP